VFVKGCGKGEVVDYLRYYSGIVMKRLGETTEITMETL
jgi:hypothetical protein